MKSFRAKHPFISVGNIGAPESEREIYGGSFSVNDVRRVGDSIFFLNAERKGTEWDERHYV